MHNQRSDETLVSFVVIEKNPFEEMQGLGFHKFRIVPRVGEYVTLNDREGKGQAYRVKALVHPLEPVDGSAGDLILEHVGTITEMFNSF